MKYNFEHLCFFILALCSSHVAPTTHKKKNHFSNRSPNKSNFEASTQLSCREGFHLKNDTCQRSIQVQPTLTCPHGHQLENTNCSKIQKYKQQLYCPKEAQLRHKECITLLEYSPFLRCPPNYNLQNGTCVSVDSNLSCPNKYSLIRNRCIISSSYKPENSCPHGFLFQKHKTKPICVKQKQFEPELFCQPPDQLVNGLCITYLTQIPEISCPNGYTFDSDQTCYKETIHPVSLTCPEGTLDRGHCVIEQQVHATEQCPHPFTLFDGFCEKIDHLPPTATCPHGSAFNEEGNCSSFTEEMPIYVCADGSETDHPKNCPHIPDRIKSTMECPDEFTFNGKECEKQLFITPSYSCPRGSQLDDTGTCFEEIVSTKALIYECDDGNVGKHCKQREIVPAEKSCHPPFTLSPDGQNCELLDTVEPNVVCERGALQDGRCVESVHVPATPNCNSNDELVGKRCIARSTYTADVVCPEGTQRSTDNLCVYEAVIAQNFVCPHGKMYKHGRCY